MRFASVPVLKPEIRASTASILRRLIGVPAPGAQPVLNSPASALPLKHDDLPRDLDQRVRLVGEW